MKDFSTTAKAYGEHRPPPVRQSQTLLERFETIEQRFMAKTEEYDRTLYTLQQRILHLEELVGSHHPVRDEIEVEITPDRPKPQGPSNRNGQ